METRNTLKIGRDGGAENDKMVVMPYEQKDMEMHNHLFFELAYITGGTAKHNLNGNISPVQSGDYFIVDYGSLHGYQESKDLTLINCLFLPELIDETLRDCRVFDELLKVCLIRYYKQYYGQTPANRIFHDENGRILSLIMEMQEEYDKKRIGFSEILRGKLLEIIILTIRKIAAEQVDEFGRKAESTVVLKAITYFKHNYRKRAVITEFCEKHHYSLQYISRKFKQETGLTALQYLQRIRVEKSCELLAGSDMLILDIIHEVGYTDAKFFHKVFRKMLQMSPGEYRRMTR